MASPAAVADQAQVQMEHDWLSAHNDARSRYGRAPMKWDAQLASDAQKWAQHLAQTDQFEHAPAGHGQGENLWMGTHGFYEPKLMVQAWIDEEKDMKSGKFPDVTLTSSWADVGHMTQLLWPSTSHVGCALVSSAEWDVLVCRYSPPGNWLGEYFDAEPKSGA